MLFAFLYVLGVTLYGFGYGVYLGVKHQGQIEADAGAQMLQQHLATLPGFVGAYAVQFCLLVPFILVAANFPNQSWRVSLGFHGVAVRSLGSWTAAMIAFVVLQMMVNGFFDIPAGEFLDALKGTKSFGLAICLVLLAPVLEEMLFRGYLFKAWRHSRIGLSGTLILTSALFVLLHWGQYHWVLMAWLFAFAVILGLARENTGSVLVPMFMHGANNLVSTILIVFLGIT